MNPSFQSTRPRGARHVVALGAALGVDVSIHAPAWGATWPLHSRTCSVTVSIHAPAWGATLDHVGLNDLGRVSIHAPAWGATPSPCPGSRSTGCFNPRARVGRDSKPSALSTSLMQFQSTRPRGARLFSCMFPTPPSWVSIHAPAWGATRPHLQGDHRRRVSIHAPAWGATSDRGCGEERTGVSIHAPAWGATPSPCPGSRQTDCFNPRARVGRDSRR